jgi:hypothetical protein
LLTLIQAAGLNQIELVPEFQSPGLVGSINSIKDVLDEHSIGNGTLLNMLFSCAPWLSPERINDMLTQLEVSLEKIAVIRRHACISLVLRPMPIGKK